MGSVLLLLGGCLFGSGPYEETLASLSGCADGAPRAMGFRDADGDGYGAGDALSLCPEERAPTAGDCDDGAADVYPTATEGCDGVDEDCDGEVDDVGPGIAPTWYADLDQDGYGDPFVPVEACTPTAMQVADATDCDDADGSIHPGATERCDFVDDNCEEGVNDEPVEALFVDADLDGFGDPSQPVSTCPGPGVSALDTDCDDLDDGVSPAALEQCGGPDEDCSGQLDDVAPGQAPQWFPDADGDGHGLAGASPTEACVAPASHSAVADDCDDLDPAVNPSATEYASDGVDSDCDGVQGACGFPIRVGHPDGADSIQDALTILASCPDVQVVLEPRAAAYARFEAASTTEVVCRGWQPGDPASEDCRIEAPDRRVVHLHAGGALRGVRVSNAAAVSGYILDDGCVLVEGGPLELTGVDLIGCEGSVGAGVYAELGVPRVVLEDVRIEDAFAAGNGAAIFLGPGVDLEGRALHVSGSDSGSGALYATGSDITLDESRFEANVAASQDGGAMRLTGGTLDLYLVDFVGNRADRGGAIQAGGTEMYLDRCTFVDNRAPNPTSTSARGGGMLVIGGSLTLASTELRGNVSGRGGAAFVDTVSQLELMDVAFVDNVDNGVSAPLAVVGSELAWSVVSFEGNTNQGSGYAAFDAFEVQASSFADDLRIVGNSGPSFAGRFTGVGFDPVVVRRLIAHDNTTNGVVDSFSVSVRYENPLMYANGGFDRPAIGMNVAAGQTLHVDHGTIVGNDGHGIGYFASGAGTVRITDSLIVGNGGTGVNRTGGSFTETLLLTHTSASGNGVDITPSAVIDPLSVGFDMVDPLLDASSDPPYQLLPGSPAAGTASDGTDRGAYGGGP